MCPDFSGLWYTQASGMNNSHDEALLGSMLAAMRLGPGDRVLDVGTGDGDVARAMARTGAWALGLDLHPGRHHALAGHPYHLAKCAGDATKLPLGRRSVDAIACRRSLHHMRDLEAAFAEMGRVLAPGGLLGIIDGIVPSGDRVAAFLHQAYDLRDGAVHVRFMTLPRWRELLRVAGLHLIRVEARLVTHDLEQWARRSNRPSPGHPRPEPPMERLRAHFESAPPVVRSTMRMAPATGVPFSFCTIEAMMLGRR